MIGHFPIRPVTAMSEFLPDDSAGDALPQSDRLQILSPEEYELLWGFPRFTQSDRDLFFTLTAPEREALEQCRSVRTKIHFLLHLGYFRARQRFFRFELPAVRDDVDYLRRRYFDNVAVADLAVSLHTRQRHIEAILGLFRYRPCALDERTMLEAHARQAVRISSRPVYVLRELVDLLRRERVVLPGYTYLQDLVREALAFERKRLAGALEGLMSDEDAKSIDRLLADDEGLHQITTIKRQPRDFTYQQLLREIERGQQLRALFALAERVIGQVELSAESVRYYASLVEFYTVYKLKRMDREAVRLYLLCFVHDRYQRLNDNLLGAFCSLVRRYVEEVDAATKEAIYRFKLQTSEDIEQGAKVLALFVDPGYRRGDALCRGARAGPQLCCRRSGCGSCAATWPARAPSTRARSSGARSMPSWARSNATCGHCCGFSRCREPRPTPGYWKRWRPWSRPSSWASRCRCFRYRPA